MLNRLSIRVRLAILAVMASLALVALGGINYWQTRQLTHALEQATLGQGKIRSQGEADMMHDALRADMPVTAFRFDGADGPEYWMGLSNFYAITRYNRSAMYAMAVHQLSELLLQARGAE